MRRLLICLIVLLFALPVFASPYGKDETTGANKVRDLSKLTTEDVRDFITLLGSEEITYGQCKQYLGKPINEKIMERWTLNPGEGDATWHTKDGKELMVTFSSYDKSEIVTYVFMDQKVVWHRNDDNSFALPTEAFVDSLHSGEINYDDIVCILGSSENSSNTSTWEMFDGKTLTIQFNTHTESYSDGSHASNLNPQIVYFKDHPQKAYIDSVLTRDFTNMEEDYGQTELISKLVFNESGEKFEKKYKLAVDKAIKNLKTFFAGEPRGYVECKRKYGKPSDVYYYEVPDPPFDVEGIDKKKLLLWAQWQTNVGYANNDIKLQIWFDKFGIAKVVILGDVLIMASNK
jgi:hypothetical protein